MPRTCEVPGWITLRKAARKHKLSYETLRHLAKKGHFTIGRFTHGSGIYYLRPSEVEAFAAGGMASLEKVRGKAVAK